MKKRTKVIALILLSVCLAAAFIAGCGGMTKQEYLEKNNAAGQSVTYFGNGGNFNSINRTEIELNYKPDSYIMIDSDNAKFNIARSNYTFDAWYYTEVDGEGNLKLNDAGEPVYGEKVEADDRIGAGEHLYVVAGWLKNVAIDVVLVTDGFDVTDSDGNVHEAGEIVNELAFGTTVNFGLSEKSVGFTAVGATYLYFFADPECTHPINSVIRPDEGDENVRVYVKYLEGDYTIVSTSKEVRNMFNASSGNGKYYLFTTDGSGVINCTDGIVMNSGSFSITVEGNGVILDNLSFTRSAISTGEISILGSLTDSAVFRNVTLRNLNVEAGVSTGMVEVYLLCHNAADGATLENVTIDTATLSITTGSNAILSNIDLDGGGTTADNWLFGGYGDDDGFLDKFGTVHVNGASLSVRYKTIADNISK